MTAIQVIDASLALALVLPGPRQDRADALMDTWRQSGVSLIAPDLWLYEVTSAITKAFHFNTLTESEGRRSLVLLHSLGVALIPPDAAQSSLAFEWTRRLGRAAAYDSFYLALAETSDADLWTADRRLAASAALPWVHVLE